MREILFPPPLPPLVEVADLGSCGLGMRAVFALLALVVVRAEADAGVRYEVFARAEFVRTGCVRGVAAELTGTEASGRGPRFPWRLPVMASPSTMMIIQTPTLASEPSSGVQWIHRCCMVGGVSERRRE